MKRLEKTIEDYKETYELWKITMNQYNSISVQMDVKERKIRNMFKHNFESLVKELNKKLPLDKQITKWKYNFPPNPISDFERNLGLNVIITHLGGEPYGTGDGTHTSAPLPDYLRGEINKFSNEYPTEVNVIMDNCSYEHDFQ